MYDVLCVGQTCCDFIYTELEEFPEPDKEVFASHCVIKAGGAANTPMALRRLGLSPLFISTVGDDLPGHAVMEYIKKVGLSTEGVLYGGGLRTSVSSVIAFEGKRSFVTCLEDCRYDLLVKRLEVYIPKCRHVHAFVSDCLNMPVVELAKKNGATLSIDTAWDESIHLPDILPILKNCDVFFVNQAEACSITGLSGAKQALGMLAGYARCVVLKMGEKGSIIQIGKKCLFVPHTRVKKVVDSTGAGDLYAAGFIYGMLQGWKLKQTAEFATACGGYAVTFYGGMDEVFQKQSVLGYIKDGRSKLESLS